MTLSLAETQLSASQLEGDRERAGVIGAMIVERGSDLPMPDSANLPHLTGAFPDSEAFNRILATVAFEPGESFVIKSVVQHTGLERRFVEKSLQKIQEQGLIERAEPIFTGKRGAPAKRFSRVQNFEEVLETVPEWRRVIKLREIGLAQNLSDSQTVDYLLELGQSAMMHG